MKEKRKSKKSRKVFSWILFFMVCIGGGYLFLHSDFFLIENVEVIGNQRVSTDAILNLGDIEIGSNMFLLDKQLTEKKIELHQLVKSAEIKRKLPSTIEIHVQEREAWAQLMIGDRCVVVDDMGVYMENVPYVLNDSDLLLISLDDAYQEPLNLGQPVCPEAIEMVKAVYQALTPEFCQEEISEYHYQTQEDMLILYTLAGTEIRFGNLDRIDVKVGYMKEIQKKEQEAQETGTGGILYVDMRFEGMPSIKDL